MRFLLICVLILVAAIMLTGCGTTYKSTNASYADELEGTASYYAEDFNGRKTSNGEIYNMNALTAAHRTLPFNSKVRVTNLDNNRKVDVRINDRGPFKGNRVIDLSYKAALEIGLISNGTAPVFIEILKLGTSSTK